MCVRVCAGNPHSWPGGHHAMSSPVHVPAAAWSVCLQLRCARRPAERAWQLVVACVLMPGCAVTAIHGNPQQRKSPAALSKKHSDRAGQPAATVAPLLRRPSLVQRLLKDVRYVCSRFMSCSTSGMHSTASFSPHSKPLLHPAAVRLISPKAAHVCPLFLHLGTCLQNLCHTQQAHMQHF